MKERINTKKEMKEKKKNNIITKQTTNITKKMKEKKKNNTMKKLNKNKY